MDDSWLRTFRGRMGAFGAHRAPKLGEIPVSIKIGVTSGCFHREHSPRAYEIIDSHLAKLDREPRDFQYQEHESGPDILVYLALGAAGANLAAAVVGLVATVLRARSEGIRRGDHPHDPLRLKLKRTRRDGQFEEEIVLELDSHSTIKQEQVLAALAEAATKLLKDDSPHRS